MPIEATVTELNVAEALLQLHGGPRDPPVISDVPRLSPDNKMEIESAATLLLSFCTTPYNPVIGQSSSDSPMARRNARQKMTRDQGTQTEGDSVNRTLTLPEIAQMDTNVTNLYARIRSLENQLRASHRTPSPRPTAELDPDVSSDVLRIQRSNNEISKKRSTSISNSTAASARNTEVSDDEWRPEEHKPSKRSFRETLHSKGTDLVPIGEGYAMVPRRLLKQIDWSSYTGATRKLLTAVFSRRVLATHSLTGKPSPAFPDKPVKKRLEPELVNDIVQIVVERCGVPESVVRTSITTKCADESKMYRSRQQSKKKSKSNKINQENVSPSPYDASFDE